MRTSFFSRQQWIWVSVALLTSLLILKYFWTLFAFDLPLGYDVGIYRYLFLKHAEPFPPWSLADMDPWARGHPLGLFLLSSVLLRIGVPVDWLLGGIWNLMPVLLALTLAWVTAKREGRASGVLTLLAAVLAIAQFDAFLAMYWKTVAALLWTVLTFHFLERRSAWAVLTGALALATHHQTGLLLGLTVITWWAFAAPREYRRFGFLTGAAFGVIGALAYLANFSDAVLPHLSALFSPGSAPGGSFPSLSFFLVHEGILLAFGLAGLFRSFDRERSLLWQCAVLWSLFFVLTHFFFYKRFFVHLEFFLLPFAARAALEAWKGLSGRIERATWVALLCVQVVASAAHVAPHAFPYWCRAVPPACASHPIPTVTPEIGAEILADIRAVGTSLPEGAALLVLDPVTVPWARGWITDHPVAGPGVFSSPWDEAGWERFLFGSTAERRALLTPLSHALFLYVSPAFRSYYGDSVDSFLADPCFQRTAHSSMLAVECP